MALGDSAGRSAGNRTGEGARRRNTQRERAHIDPPWDDTVVRYQLTERGEKLLTVLSWVAITLSLVTFLAILGLWFGVWTP